MNTCTTCKQNLNKQTMHICMEHCNQPFCWGCLNDHALVWMTNLDFNINKEKTIENINNNKSIEDKYNNHLKDQNKPENDDYIQQFTKNDKTNKETQVHPLMQKGAILNMTDIYNKDKEFYDFSNFEFKKIANRNQILGSGAFGEVILAKHKKEDKKYACKVMNKAKLIKNQVKLSDIEREIDIHAKLDHPYIIKLICHHQDYENYYMILDYAKNGTLYTKMKKMKHGFSEETAFKYFIQSCSAIYFLHKNKLAHRDIKPENLLLDENNNIKLADFGWCDYFNHRDSRMSITTKDSNNKKCFNDVCGTYEYMAPEIVKEEAYDEKVDIWSLGVLLYELLHGKSPYIDNTTDNKTNNVNLEILLSKIKNNRYDINPSLTPQCKDLIDCK